MGKNKNTSPSPEPNGEEGKHIDFGEAKRRLEALEKSASDLNNRVFDWQKTFTTIVFVALSAMLTVYGVMSRMEVRDLTAKVDRSIEEMKRNFDELSREAVRKPIVEIVHKNKPLNGQTVPSGTSLRPLFLKNVGSKSTEPISIRFFCSSEISMSSSSQMIPSVDPDFPFSYYVYLGNQTVTIGAGEAFVFDEAFSFSYSGGATSNVVCKLHIYYGGDKPAEALFSVSPK